MAEPLPSDAMNDSFMASDAVKGSFMTFGAGHLAGRGLTRAGDFAETLAVRG